MAIVAFDTETTGFDPARDRVVELYAVALDGPFARWRGYSHWLLDPGIPIPPEATAVHGFVDHDVVGKPRFEDIAAEVQRLVADAIIVAYNGLRLDVPLLDAELRRAGQPGIQPGHPCIDPYVVYREEVPHTLSGAVPPRPSTTREGRRGRHLEGCDALRSVADEAAGCQDGPQGCQAHRVPGTQKGAGSIRIASGATESRARRETKSYRA